MLIANEKALAQLWARAALRPTTCRRSFTWVSFRRWQDSQKGHDDYEHYKQVTRIQTAGGYWTVENPAEAWRKVKDDSELDSQEKIGVAFDFHQTMVSLKYLDLSPLKLKRSAHMRKFVANQFDQRFIAERHLVLGPDLAAAHFLVHRGAAVKFVGDGTWYKKNALGQYSLPDKHVPDLFVEAIDASGTALMSEALDNLINLKHLRLLRLADCVNMNDWCLSKFTNFEKSLEYLDLSGCTRISAKGLAALSCLKKLKGLRLERMDKVNDLAKVSLLLESSIPGLLCSGVSYDLALQQMHKEETLLLNERVVQDAKGNMHLYDNNAHLYCIGGPSIDNINQRAVVDELDRPMMTSIILRDCPDLPLSDLERLDSAVDGRLRRLLLGSPSSVHWKQDMLTLLTHRHNTRKYTHPLLMPGSVTTAAGAIEAGTEADRTAHVSLIHSQNTSATNTKSWWHRLKTAALAPLQS